MDAPTHPMYLVFDQPKTGPVDSYDLFFTALWWIPEWIPAFASLGEFNKINTFDNSIKLRKLKITLGRRPTG